MAPAKTIDDYMSTATRPSRTTSTKRKLSEQDESNTSDKENVDESEAPNSKQRKTNAGGRSKAAVKPKASNNAKAAQKIFYGSIKAHEKAIASLDKRVKALSPNSRAIDITNYATIARKQLPAVAKLSEMDLPLALQLMLSTADGAVTDLDVSFRISGQGEHHGEFDVLDEALLPLIEKMAIPGEKLQELPKVTHRWTRADADVGPFRTGRPNKQQRNQMWAQRLDWEKER